MRWILKVWHYLKSIMDEVNEFYSIEAYGDEWNEVESVDKFVPMYDIEDLERKIKEM